jgi:peptidoglycan/xylan/chitin deacetylase (PgdA/CDA1 family)
MYLVRTPALLKWIYKDCLWQMPGDGGRVYLTFDDGPHPEITAWVLDQLAAYGAKGSFFCIGDNVRKFPETYQRILDEGHSVGNHTFHHLNGWKTEDDTWFSDIGKASALIDSSLFRPPYGRIRLRQVRRLRSLGMRPVMWSVLSGDFDQALSGEVCAANVLDNMRPGSVVVFHDSEKAEDRLRYALPLVLQMIKEKGWLAEKL